MIIDFNLIVGNWQEMVEKRFEKSKITLRPAYFGLNKLDFQKIQEISEKKPTNGHAVKWCDHKAIWG